MKANGEKYLASFLVGVLFSFTCSLTWAQFPNNAKFTTLITAPFPTEGLTGDNDGNLYSGGNNNNPPAVPNGTNCPVWRVNTQLANPSLEQVGTISGTCNPLGIAFNKVNDLFVANGATGTIHTFTPSASNPPLSTIFASGVPGANGIAFDKHGELWVSDGVQNQGRVWKISPCNTFPAIPCAVTEVFRIPPMRNSSALGGDIAGDGVGRQNRDVPPGTLATTIANPVGAPLPVGVTLNPEGTQVTFTPQGGQDLVANGLAFIHSGDLFVADTARGAIWKVEFDSHGNLKPGQTGCDETFHLNALCFDNIFVAHPLLEGADGIALDVSGNIYVAANERNAVVGVDKSTREVKEIFRNPVNAAGLRNSADPAVGNDHILEFNTSPFLLGNKFCVSNSDLNRRDNSPSTGGEIGGAGQPRGKISCLTDQSGNLRSLTIPGLPLPIH